MLEVEQSRAAPAMLSHWLCCECAQKTGQKIWAAGLTASDKRRNVHLILAYIIAVCIHYTLKLIWDEGLCRLQVLSRQ